MAYRPPEATPDFARLYQYLNNSGMQQKNIALYQTIKLLIQWLERFKLIQTEGFNNAIPDISGLVALVVALTQAEYLTWSDQITVLPNSRQLVAGSGISFDDSVAGEREISSVGGSGGGYVPLALGEEPLVFVSDGAGQPILIEYEP